MVKKSVLGQGISSLIKNNVQSNLMEQINKTTIDENTPYIIDINLIEKDGEQPRKIFNQKELEELSRSIKENGVLQPLIITEGDNNNFKLIAGERRLRASVMAGLEQVPVIIKKVTDKEKSIISIIENIQRADLNCIEIAYAYYKLMNDFKITQEELARKVGKERSSIANYLRILGLPKDIIELLRKDKLSLGHAKVLVGIGDDKKQLFYAEEVIKNNLSVRSLEKIILKGRSKKKKPIRQINNDIDSLRQELERATGFHFVINDIKEKNMGEIKIKYTSKEEFNSIYNYLLKS